MDKKEKEALSYTLQLLIKMVGIAIAQTAPINTTEEYEKMLQRIQDGQIMCTELLKSAFLND